MKIMDSNRFPRPSQEAVRQIAAAVSRLLSGRNEPLVVALDGGSGAGKSALAAEVAAQLEAAVLSCDDFFDAAVTDEEWDSCTPEQKCRRCIDWKRMRAEALLPLLEGKPAAYRPFSFSTGSRLATSPVTVQPAPVILLDGIYSSLPELSDVVHLTVLVDVSPDVRRQRHNRREGGEDADWHSRWDPAEDYYFSALRPPASFDLIVLNR